MLHKTRGIVLHHFRYSDTSVIAHIYTEALGRRSYMVKGACKEKSRIRANYLQPLSPVGMEVHDHPGKELQTIRELYPLFTWNSIPYHPVKTSIALFLSEILYKSLKEEIPHPELFDFLINAIRKLDEEKDHVNDFHLLFLVQLTKYLGFHPGGEYREQNPFFDLINGVFVSCFPYHQQYLNSEQSFYFNLLLESSLNDGNTIRIKSSVRRELLKKIVEYYQYHLLNLKEIKSMSVLQSVFE